MKVSSVATIDYNENTELGYMQNCVNKWNQEFTIL